jgi:hypothetical protein
MLDELYMRDLANAMKMPDEVVPAGKVTVSAPEPEMAGMDKAFVGTRLNTPKAGQAQPTQQDREKMAIGLLDTLAGALRGAAAQVGGLPGDIRSILDMINQEGAEKYLGQRSFATTEEILADTSVRVPGTKIDVPFPPVLKEGVPNRAERQKAVEVAQEVGTFLPAPGIPEAAIQGVKAVGKAIKATKNMPVGMSTQAVGQGMDELGFYSAAKQAVDAIQQPKGTGAQFLAQISKTPGVKPDEIKWTGLDEFLQSKKSVTKAEVQEYLDKNRVQIKEVTLGSNANPYPYRTADEWQGAIDQAERARDFDEAERLTSAWEMFEGVGMSDQTKFSKYTLPGGENYREILLTLPAKSTSLKPNAVNIINERLTAKGYGQLDEDQIDLINKGDTTAVNMLKDYSDRLGIETNDILSEGAAFRSQHFDQPNILAHIRVNDRVVDGKKTLFVEEVQSDWHQAGRKKGYDTPQVRQNIAKERQKLLDQKDYYAKLAEPYAAQGKDSPTEIIDGWTKAANGLQELQRIENSMSKAVPDAPFKTTWSDLSMKRIIQLASEGGYDRIAFTTGKTQAERFDLSKQISEVSLSGTNLVAYDKQGNTVIKQTGVTKDNLADYIGKEPAQKLLDQEPQGTLRTISGVDLEVGGEGMKGFYDDILPKFLDKYAKKWDAKTGMTSLITDDIKFQEFYNWALTKDKSKSYTSIQSSFKKKDNLYKQFATELPIKGDEVRYIDVTPKMRESVVTKGQPMFAIGAGGAGAAATQEENK